MKFGKFGDSYFIRLEKGEEIVSSLEKLCRQEKIRLGEISGLGAASSVRIGLFDIDENQFFENHIEEPLEIASITGNVSEMDGEVYLHIHAVAAGRDGKAVGGHLKEAVISATAEIFIRCLDGAVDRFFDPEIGLNLLSL
ncbi:MAG: DNA-binding protein [Christensenellaceae bacterium]|nr:DNA-binding protein [Christensenellaceae bacterium]